MRRRPGLVALLSAVMATLLSVPGAMGTATAADLTPLPAMQSDKVVDAYGIGIHLPFLDTPYADAGRVADALADLGVRHVRDDLYLDNPRQYAGIRTVAERGIAFNLIMGRPDRPGTPTDYAETVAGLPAGAVESVEGINEWDLFGASNPQWAFATATWQQRLYQATKSNPRTAHLPVLSPSLAFKGNFTALPDLSASSDKANAHMYPGGYKPSNEISQMTSALRTVVPQKPLVVTEAGYHNAIDPQAAGGHRGVPESVSAAYLPRLLLEHIARGHERVYSYELIDEFADPANTDPEANFGLLRRDWTPKPAYTSMKTLLGLLADPGPPFATEPLQVASAGWPSDGRYRVTQKRDGSYVLLLWRDAQIYDPVSRAPMPDPTAEVTMRFGRPFDMAVHRLSHGAAPVSSTTGSSITVPMDGSVTAITLEDPAPAPEAAPAAPVVSPARVPNAPRIVSTSTGKRWATLRWRAPAANGRPILGYRMKARGKVRHVAPGKRTATVRGLPRHQRIKVVIRARNAIGWSAPRARWVRTR